MSQPLKTLFNGSLPEAILYDLDGTLVDSVPDLALGIREMLAQLDLPDVTEDQVRCWVGNGAQVLVRRALAAVELSDAQIDARFEEAFPLFLDAYQANLNKATVLYEGVLALLESAQQAGIRQAVVTNKPYRFTPPILDALGIAHYFQAVVGGDTLAQKKPDPEPLLFAAAQLDALPQHCLMVGDSINDVRAARAAGMPVVAVPYGYNHGEPIADANPDRVVSNLAELVFVG